jgi:capsular polysaccharide transport system ATP-binding protein
MITLHHVHKTYHTRGVSKVVARDLSFEFPTMGAMGLLGRNGVGKSSLLHMLAGIMRPDHGKITRHGSVSWPVGFQGSFHPDLTGVQNARFVARVYGVDTDTMLDFVADFAELGPHLNLPLRSYSSGMRARLAFAVSMAVPFDSYLIDEVTSVGDGAFRARSEAMLQDRMQKGAAVVVSHSMDLLRRLCHSGAVLENGRLFYYARIERAIEHHDHLMQGQLPPWMR